MTYTQCLPLANEPGISLIILTPMKILEWNLSRSRFVVWEMKRNVSVVRFKIRCNILISGKIIKEMPGSVASGTHSVPLLCVQWRKTSGDGQSNCPNHVEFYSKNKFLEISASSWFYYNNLSRCMVTWTSDLMLVSLPSLSVSCSVDTFSFMWRWWNVWTHNPWCVFIS